MARKYIRLRLTANELDRLKFQGVKINPIAHQAISHWQTLDKDTQSQLIKQRLILYITNPPIVKVVGADRRINAWLSENSIENESSILSTAIGCILSPALLTSPLEKSIVLPEDLASKLRSRGGDPIEHLRSAINQYLINC